MMKTKRGNISPEREYDRALYRSELVSLFWGIIMERKKSPKGFTLKKLSELLSVDKAQVSRWFNDLPNWEANTVADIASALDVDLEVVARDRNSGKVYSSAGARPKVSTSTQDTFRPLQSWNTISRPRIETSTAPTRVPTGMEMFEIHA